MALAGIPVGVWRDAEGVMDATTYDGLTEISTLEDWLAFERDVQLRPDMILARQQKFLSRLPMPSDPADVYRRFARLIVGLLTGVTAAGAKGGTERAAKARRAKLAGDVLVQVPA
jgi:hypothetical protein